MRKAMERREAGIRWSNEKRLTDLLFANDVLLLAHEEGRLQEVTTSLNSEATMVGLRISDERSKDISIGFHNAQTDINVNGKQSETALLVSYYPGVGARVVLFLYEVGIVYHGAYAIVVRRDSNKLRDIYSGVHLKNAAYTLSTKFQLRENLRVMKVLMQLSVVWAMSASLGCVSLILATTVLVDYAQWSRVSFALFNFAFAISPNIVAWVFMTAIGGFHLRCLLPWHSEKRLHEKRAISEHRGASDAYFKQLVATWEV
ncbi:hypothetical protein TELCIR_02373 [Teladorsagia circumcincta]|uniref:Reverse transcriptase domain-containing protein n=1 Tax=Teladorsagia circumcincta TaxID=45464 RepID=A0A2G9UZC3_TELCI|nr:hypothetical protein TELCIR_02373 [Teladorsagia circumcincta]